MFYNLTPFLTLIPSKYVSAYFTDIGSHTLGGGMVPLPGSGTGSGSGTTQNLKNVDHVRNYFPETWLWTNATVG